METKKPDSTHSSESSSTSFEFSRQTANQKKTKLVIRKIPQFVTEDTIKSHLTDFKDKYNYFHFTCQPPEPNPTRRNKQRFNRFYINFISFSESIPFIEKFQKLEFTKPKPKKTKPPSPKTEEEKEAQKKKDLWAKYGNIKAKPIRIYKLQIEFAPNQSIPNQITTKDRRVGTILKDNDYITFCESLETTKKEVEKTSKIAAETLIRRNVISLKQKIKDKKDKKDDKKVNKNNENDEKKREFAPLAQHVATKRHRRQSYKKINRAALIKTEKLKEKEITRIRETRRRKRIALAKAAKYGKKQWIAKRNKSKNKNKNKSKDNEQQKDDRDRHHDHDRDNDEYYNDWDYEYDNTKRRREYGRNSGKNRYRGKGRRGRGRGGGGGGYGDRDRDRDRDMDRGDDGGHFSGYSRRKGQQTWKAK